jgi:3-oxoacyl-[acyl-carrier protein] reductase
MRLAGKRAVITGGGRGIGAAIARAFVREGARVCINTPEPVSSCEALIEELNTVTTRGSEMAFAYQADVRDEAQIRAMFETAARVMNGVDILINNAGV